MMTLTLLGTGGATPYALRTTPMAVVNSGKTALLFDCGSGACLRLSQAGVQPSTIEAIFFSHFHADHCVDLPLVILSSYLDGRKRPMRICGPSGTKAYVRAIEELYSYIPRLVRNVTGAEVQLEVTELDGGGAVEGPEWRVTAARAKHGVPALGYRITDGRSTLVISGDTEPTDDIVAAARGAAVLVHDCSFPDSIGEAPGHTLPKELGGIAAKAGVRTLVLTHLFQEVVGQESAMIASIRANYDGEIVVGTDLLRIVLEGESVHLEE